MEREIHDSGLSVGDLIESLRNEGKKLPVYIASDEEQNTLYKGLYIQKFADCIVLAGLSGVELDE